jgi:hypothetical protein
MPRASATADSEARASAAAGAVAAASAVSAAARLAAALDADAPSASATGTATAGGFGPSAMAPGLRPPPTPPSAGSMAVTAPVLSTVSTPRGGQTERRPINPFLANDPNQKAKRLARALVSDMLAYHPGRRDEGLANGTLKQIFREEIKKSYEEYVDQIGRDFAETTTHFQDALNELLAAGKKMF